MVAHFKLAPGRRAVYRITGPRVEEVIARRGPWFVPDTGGGGRTYALCAHCENPIRLKALHGRSERSPRPYGSHVGHAVAGFAFDAGAMDRCPYVAAPRKHAAGARRGFDGLAEKLIELAVAEFDRAVRLLREDLEVGFSNRMAERMLKAWFAGRGYLYRDADLRNLPWMIAYFMGSMNLYGQKIGGGDLAEAVLKQVRGAGLDHYGRLVKATAYFHVSLQCLDHRRRIGPDGELVETLHLRVQDFTRQREARRAPVLYHKTIRFAPERFEALTRPGQAGKRHRGLLKAAREIEAASNWRRHARLPPQEATPREAGESREEERFG